MGSLGPLGPLGLFSFEAVDALTSQVQQGFRAGGKEANRMMPCFLFPEGSPFFPFISAQNEIMKLSNSNNFWRGDRDVAGRRVRQTFYPAPEWQYLVLSLWPSLTSCFARATCFPFWFGECCWLSKHVRVLVFGIIIIIAQQHSHSSTP